MDPLAYDIFHKNHMLHENMYFALPHGRLYFRSTILLTIVMAVFVSLLDVGLDYQTNLYAQLSYSKKLPNSAPRYHEQIQSLTSSLCQASTATRGHEDDWDIPRNFIPLSMTENSTMIDDLVGIYHVPSSSSILVVVEGTLSTESMHAAGDNVESTTTSSSTFSSSLYSNVVGTTSQP
jgi:hypothetical protein